MVTEWSRHSISSFLGQCFLVFFVGSCTLKKRIINCCTPHLGHRFTKQYVTLCFIFLYMWFKLFWFELLKSSLGIHYILSIASLFFSSNRVYMKGSILTWPCCVLSGFVPHIDQLFDEDVLIGSGWTARESLRPLAYSTLADLVHHVRSHLPLHHLSLAVHLFSKNVHDESLPVSIQTMSCKVSRQVWN